MDKRIVMLAAAAVAAFLFIGCDGDDDCDDCNAKVSSVQVGPRPYYLVDKLENSELKETLAACENDDMAKTEFSIGHRGAALQFPEHSKESYMAAIRMGAGIVECDVTFTKDKELVCRHSQCDLHTTTDILEHADLREKCTVPPVLDGDTLTNASQITCCTSDITLAEFKTLNAKMDAADTSATTIEAYMDATPGHRTDRYSDRATVMTHAQSIALFKAYGVKMTPELKTPSVAMPYEGMSQEDFAQKMIDEYKDADVDPSNVFAQSFLPDDVLYWINNEPEFGKQAVFLDGRDESPEWVGFDPNDATTWEPYGMAAIKALGVNYIAPPTWFLVKLDENNNIVPSLYATEAKAADLKIITWTLERSGLLVDGGGYYYQSITDVVDNEGVTYELLDVLAKDVGVVGVFSDWPATTTYYGNCMGIK